MEVAVVGGGITGLAAAWELLQAGVGVTVFEASHRLGGKVLTEDVGGRPVDLGPDSFLGRVPDALDLCWELGIDDEVVSPATEQAAVWVRGRLRPLPQGMVLGVPTSLASLARSGILSLPGLGRAALELVLPRRDRAGDRSVGDLVTARFGRQVHERLVDPLLGGVHAGPTDRLSMQATAPQLAAVATEGGGSLLTALRAQRRAAAAAGEAGGPVFRSLRGGLGRLVHRLGQELHAAGVQLRLRTELAELPAGFEAVIAATPAPTTAALVAPASPEAASELRAIDHASVTLTVLVYPEAALPRPLTGSGFLVPRGERRLMTACSFGSSKWPHWASPGNVVLRVSAGRWGDKRALGMGDTELVDRLHGELTEALGLREPPHEVRVSRWVDAFPQYRVGHLERVARVEQALNRDLPGVVVAGGAYRGIGIPACIGQGRAAARRVLEAAG